MNKLVLVGLRAQRISFNSKFVGNTEWVISYYIKKYALTSDSLGSCNSELDYLNFLLLFPLFLATIHKTFSCV